MPAIQVLPSRHEVALDHHAADRPLAGCELPCQVAHDVDLAQVVLLTVAVGGVDHDHFRAPTALPVLGAVACAYLASPLSGRAGADYRIAAVLMVVGVALWAVTAGVQRFVLHERVEPDPERLERTTP